MLKNAKKNIFYSKNTVKYPRIASEYKKFKVIPNYSKIAKTIQLFYIFKEKQNCKKMYARKNSKCEIPKNLFLTCWKKKKKKWMISSK